MQLVIVLVLNLPTLMVVLGPQLDNDRSSSSVEFSLSRQAVLPDLCVMSEITLDFLQSLLKDEYPDVSIQHFEVGVVIMSRQTDESGYSRGRILNRYCLEHKVNAAGRFCLNRV